MGDDVIASSGHSCVALLLFDLIAGKAMRVLVERLLVDLSTGGGVGGLDVATSKTGHLAKRCRTQNLSSPEA